MFKAWALLAVAVTLNFTKKSDGAGFTQINGERQNVPAVMAVKGCADGQPSQGKSPAWYLTPDGWLCILGIPTLFFVGWQAKATARSAKATEESAGIALQTAKHQLRAYVAVVIGSATYQERRPEDTGGDLRFECRPLLVNTGQTPARNLRFKARSAILPIPLPPGMNLPEGFDEGIGESIMAPQQKSNMFATVEGFCQDSEVESIKKMVGPKALFTWGLVTYRDIFGEAHSTRFCHQVYWIGDEVHGLYVPGRNNAD